MASGRMAIKVIRIGLGGADISVEYETSDGERAHHPKSIDVGPGGLVVEWRHPPADLREASVSWRNPPFMKTAFSAGCDVIAVGPESVHLRLTHVSDDSFQSLREWIKRVQRHVVPSGEDYAVKASEWYTWATLFSAWGLFCGALGLFLPAIFDSAWIEKLSVTLVIIMVISIALFAGSRKRAGRFEREAIRAGQA